MSLSIRQKRFLIALCFHSVVIGICLLGAKTGTLFHWPILYQVSAIILLLHLITFKIIPFSRYLQERLITEAVCPGCGEIVELIGLYKCGCGFVPAIERHAFSPCPFCRKYYQWAVCPACETSILI